MHTIQKSSIIALLAAVLMSACTAKVSDVLPSGSPVPTIKDTVNGPALDGTWASDCIKDSAGVTRIIQMTIFKNAAQRIVDHYSDANCTENASSEHWEGSFRFTDKKANDVYEIEYDVMLGGTNSELRYENIKIDSGVLLISDMKSGSVEPSIALKQATTAPPPSAGDFTPTFGDAVQYEETTANGVRGVSYLNQGQDSDGSWIVDLEIGGVSQGSSNYNDLWSSVKYRAEMAKCQAPLGTVETVTTKAGSFVTCREENDDSIIWFGNVPFLGIVKQVAKDGSFQAVLTSYTLGNR